MAAYHKINAGGIIKDSNIPYFATEVVVLTNNPTHGKNLMAKGWEKMDLKENNLHPWTDTYATPLRALFGKKLGK